MNKFKIELLSPAGDVNRGKIALNFGADAIYFGAKMYSLRARASNFDLENIEEIINYAHANNKKVYIVTNILCHNGHIKNFEPFIKKILAFKPDGFICADPFIISKIRELDQNVEIHISTQQSTTNSKAAAFWKRNGSSRIVLAREVTYNEMKQMVSSCNDINMDIEYFIHGAVCIGYSGRCMLSDNYCLRNANFGGCAQSCRWIYTLFDQDKVYSDHFSMSAKDMCQLPNLKEILELGIKSLKIEGRMKTEHYIATVNQVYSNAINEIYEHGSLSNEKLNEYTNELEKIANRETDIAWFNGKPSYKAMLSSEAQKQVSQIFVFVINKKISNNTYEIISRNFFKITDSFEIISPKRPIKHAKIIKILDKDNNSISIVNKPMCKYIVTFETENDFMPNDLVRIVK